MWSGKDLRSQGKPSWLVMLSYSVKCLGASWRAYTRPPVTAYHSCCISIVIHISMLPPRVWNLPVLLNTECLAFKCLHEVRYSESVLATNFNIEKYTKTKLNVNLNQQTHFSCNNCSWKWTIYTARQKLMIFLMLRRFTTAQNVVCWRKTKRNLTNFFT